MQPNGTISATTSWKKDRICILDLLRFTTRVVTPAGAERPQNLRSGELELYFEQACKVVMNGEIMGTFLLGWFFRTSELW